MDLFSQIHQIEFSAPLPGRLLEVEQRFDAPKVADVAAATRAALEASGILAQMRPGQTVAVGVGSRGVANLREIVAAAVQRLVEAQLRPFVVPAMGSHGGATAEGQLDVLAQLGVTEGSVGAPLRATMEVKEIGRLPQGMVFYQGLDSAAADHTLLISRVKPHTDFRGEVESGPAKMAVIGLGKQAGALAMHALGGAAFQQFLRPAAALYAKATNLAGALAVVENADDETASIVGLTADEIGAAREMALLAQAKELMASLPFGAIDVLVVREIGKNISGTGLDTNIIGRLLIPRQPETFGAVDVAVIVVLDLSEATHGNATGMGLANITTQRMAAKIDWAATYTNGLTSGIFSMYRGSLPMVMADDRRALQAASHCCAMPQPGTRMVFIENTLQLRQLWISPSLEAEARVHPRLHIAGERPLCFAPDGALVSPWAMQAEAIRSNDTPFC
jgi:hypothetical protein